VLICKFSLRQSSGGTDQYRGGHGVIRRIKFYAPMTASILIGQSFGTTRWSRG
jgi:5-oxoprolinase (ATP-hydrolysing)